MAPQHRTITRVLWFLVVAPLMLSSLAGCDGIDNSAATGRATTSSKASGITADSKTIPVQIGSKRTQYDLEIAATPDVRMKGLGGRTEIPERGGMIFVFPDSEVRPLGFVMRDCPIDIDIVYLDGAGRVLNMFEMKAEPARDPASEGKPGDMGNFKYESRLKQYNSGYPATFAVELKSGSIRAIGVKPGDVMKFDTMGLKKIAR